jgi:hypothetical protein
MLRAGPFSGAVLVFLAIYTLCLSRKNALFTRGEDGGARWARRRFAHGGL